MSSPTARLTYASRASLHPNPAAKSLLQTISRKESNLSVSVDVPTSFSLLAIIDTVGPYVCLIKTHIDILDDFSPELIPKLQALAEKHDFMYFEDRKFADIGNTVQLQYSRGVHRISSWAHLTNAHSVPGPSIITGLGAIGRPLGRGLLLLAEMSTAGALTKGSYTDETVRMARANKDFVVGFIAQRRMEGVALADGVLPDEEEDFLILSPGVGLESKGDAMGQQYRTPKEVVRDAGCDVIIVGRGVYGSDPTDVESIRARAEVYKREGWNAYLERIS